MISLSGSKAIPSSDSDDESSSPSEPLSSSSPLWYQSKGAKVCFLILGILYMFPWGTVILIIAATTTVAVLDSEDANQNHLGQNGNFTFRRNVSTVQSYQHMMEIEPKFYIHWNDPNLVSHSVDMQVVHYGMGWVALGISPESAMDLAENAGSDLMIGSDAIIGLPSESKVQYYEITSKSLTGVQPKSSSAQKTITNKYVSQSSTKTVMSFTKTYPSGKEEDVTVIHINSAGPNTFIYAYGSTNTLGFHAGCGAFQLDFSRYSTPSSVPDSEITNANDKITEPLAPPSATITPPTSLIYAHGALASVAFLVALPIAFSAAILREMPCLAANWFCINLCFNVIAWCLALSAVICATTAVSRSEMDHLTNRHEILGLTIMIGLTFHIAGALYRPAKDLPDTPQSCTKRHAWKTLHQCVGVVILILGLAQVYDGMVMLQQSYGVQVHLTAFFWAIFVPWVILVALMWTVGRPKEYERAVEEAEDKASQWRNDLRFAENGITSLRGHVL